MNGRTVLVIGADGVLGSTVAAVFARAGWTVLHGTRRRRRAPESVLIDLSRPETIGPALAAADLTINTVADADLAAETWALANGARVVNIATVPVGSARRLRIHAAQQRPRGAVLLNAGLAPGIINLVIADMLARHPHADAIEFVMCLPASGMSGPAGVSFVHESLTTIGRYGVYTKRSPNHDTLVVDLPNPVGQKRCFGFGERERAWLLDTAGGRTVRTFAYLDRPALHNLIVALNPLGLLSEVPKAPFLIGRHSAPQQPSTELVVHRAAVTCRGALLEAQTIECVGAYLHAAAAAEIFGAEFLRATISAGLTGCFNPDELFTLEHLGQRIHNSGIGIVNHQPTTAISAGDHQSAMTKF